MKRKIKKLIPKRLQGFIKKQLQYLKRIDCIVLYTFYKITKKQNPKKVLFISDSRSDITGNFEYIYKRLQKEKDYELNTFLKKTIKEHKTFKEKKELMKLIAESKFVLIDDFYPLIYTLKLRKNTRLIQVWHAMGAFKTVGYSRMGKVGGPTSYSLTHRNYSATIVSSEGIRKNYAEAFNMDIKKVHATGIPRTDIFFDKDYKSKVEKRIYKKYPKLKDKKVILFAPTFRGNGQATAYYDFSLLDFKKIKEKYSKDYVFIVRPHPFTKNLNDMPKEDDFYISLTEEREINDLLFITDILITDYSSVIFENSLLNNKAIFFVPDLEEYIESRDFYYDFKKYTYGDVCRNMDELLKAIDNPKLDTKKLKEFKEYFVSGCDGNSTEKFVQNLILNEEIYEK